MWYIFPGDIAIPTASIYIAIPTASIYIAIPIASIIKLNSHAFLRVANVGHVGGINS